MAAPIPVNGTFQNTESELGNVPSRSFKPEQEGALPTCSMVLWFLPVSLILAKSQSVRARGSSKKPAHSLMCSFAQAPGQALGTHNHYFRSVCWALVGCGARSWAVQGYGVNKR